MSETTPKGLSEEQMEFFLSVLRPLPPKSFSGSFADYNKKIAELIAVVKTLSQAK